MKIVFLDIDGVLNSLNYRRRMGMQYFSDMIDRRKMPLLKKIVEATNAKIVLSTTWRKYWNEGESQLDPAGENINRIFGEYGMSVYSKTPVLENSGRAAEIKAWLRRNPYVEGFVILDDKDFGWPADLRAHFIRTDLNGDGLEEAQVREAIAVLNGNLMPVEKNIEKGKFDIATWLRKFWSANKNK